MKSDAALLLPLSIACLVLGVVGASGCGTCSKVGSSRESFLAAQQASPPDDRPHLRLEIPDALINQWLDGALSGLPKVGVTPPALGDLARYTGGLDLAARRLRLQVDRSGPARFDLDLDVQRGGRTLFGMQLGAVSPVRVDTASRKMTIPLRADLFESVQPRLEGGAVDRYTDALLGELPALARPLFPRAAVRRLAEQSLQALVGQAYRLVRQQLLTPLGDLASFEVQLPDVPLTGVTLQTAPGGWLVEARTSLPSRGLAAAPRLGAQGQTLRLSFAAEAVAELGNWAMSRGKLPSRYTASGKPDAQGDYVAGVGWASGTRPLQAKLWSQSAAQQATDLCLYVQAAAVPKVELSGGKLQVGFSDGKVEELIGPPGVAQAMDVLGITRRIFEYTQTVSGNTTVALGRGSRRVELTSAALGADVLRFDLQLGGAPRTEAEPTPAAPTTAAPGATGTSKTAALAVAGHRVVGRACGR